MKKNNADSLIKVQDLIKYYSSSLILNSINFEMHAHEIVGLIGPNGAGKTTLLRILCTLLSPSGGKVFIKGLDLNSKTHEIREIIGYMPEDAGLYLRQSCYDHLVFYASFYPKKDMSNRMIDDCLQEFNLSDVKDIKVHGFSKGMKQKMHFIKSIIHDPQIIMLDEPFNSMDTETRMKIRKIILRKREEGKLIILSTHILSEIEEMCDRIIIIKKGNIVGNFMMEELRKQNKFSLEKTYMEIIQSS